MYNVVTNITITQRPSSVYPNRNKVLRIPMCHQYDYESNWEDLTDTGRVLLPRNIFFTDDKGQKFSLKSSGVNVGGFTDNPLILRGDNIVLSSGYSYFKNNIQVTETAEIINGYISKVSTTTPIELQIEDNMWLLKQTPLKDRTFTDSETLEDLLQYICDAVNARHGVNFTYKQMTKTGFGTFIVSNESAAQVLSRLKSTYGFVSFFRGDVLHSGINIQYSDETFIHTFYLNGDKGNVPADGQELEYKRKDDIVHSAVAHNTVVQETGDTTKDGHAKTKKVRLQVLVTFKNNEYTSKVIQSGERVPENEEGERREFYFPSAKTTDELIRLTKEELNRYFYTGLTGTFDTFGIPFVKHGDNIKLFNPEQPEQDGTYRIKKVSYTGGVNGLRQTITLYYKI